MIEIQVIRKAKTVQVPESDVIPLAEAARKSGRSMQAIGALVDVGKLPWLEWCGPDFAKTEGRAKRFTRLSAVEALPPIKARKVKPTKAK